MRSNRRLAATAAALFVIVPAIIIANSTTTPPRNTNAPGDGNCTACHTGTLNPGEGFIKFDRLFSTYTPGTAISFEIELEQVNATVHGFQATARLGSDPSAGQAGTWTTPNSDTVVICDNGSTRAGGSCPDTSPVEFIQHSMPDSDEDFDVIWTPPDSDVGPITIYAAMVGADGDNTAAGDVTYTAMRELTYQAPHAPPTVTAVTQAWDYSNRASEGTFIVIWGENFGGIGRTWSGDEFNPSPDPPGSPLQPGAIAPFVLDDIQVRINGQNAFVSYVGDKQINAVVHGDTGTGPGGLEVMTLQETSNLFPVTIGDLSPVIQEHPLWVEGDKKFAVVHATDFKSYANKEGLVPDGDKPMSPGVPDQWVTVFALGCGPTDPAVPPGTVPAGGEAIVSDFEVRIGGMTAEADGVLSSNVALYQFNIKIPALQPGDHMMELTVNGIPTGQGLYFTVGGASGGQ